MEITTQKENKSYAIKFTVKENNEVIGRARLYILFNDLHAEPYGFLEDLFVNEEHRGKGIGKQLINALINEAKSQKCYKIIGTSRHARPEVHAMYEKIGFKDYGKEFRMDL